MTLTELKYIVAVARHKHFGKAAEACFVSQPTLSVSIKKLEEELQVKLFERHAGEVAVTALGAEIVRQAQSVLEQAAEIRQIAKRGKNPLASPLKLGVIPTIGPYLLPELVRHNIRLSPQMPLLLQETYTVRLLEMLRSGDIDCAILAEPFPETNLAIAPLYDEPFLAAVPAAHPLAAQSEVSASQIKEETMLLLGAGHCFRDHVLQVCPEHARFSSHTEGIAKSFEGSSLETIQHMVAAGMGITLVPRMAAPKGWQPPPPAPNATDTTRTGKNKKTGKKPDTPEPAPAPASAELVRYLPLQDDDGGPPPSRRVVLAWRRSFTRYEAIAALRNAIYACELPGVHRLTA